MYLQLKELILWPNNPNYEPRRVKFELGKVNVITGSSRSGKSAIIPIIDYCLGSSNCSIPVGIIRDSCSWFGLVVSFKEAEMLLARRNPGLQKQTGDMYILEGIEVTIPDIISERNEDAEGVKRRLGELAGLPMLDYGDDDKGYTSRPSFRDTISFLFQSQNIIANQDILFYKTNEYKYQERLRLIFPYVLNAVNAEWFFNKHQLNEATKQLKIKEKLFDQNQKLFQCWISDIRAKSLKAKELGLIDKDVAIDGNPEYLLGILRELSQRGPVRQTIDSTVVESISDDLQKLRNKEERLSSLLSKFKRRIADMDDLKSTSYRYHQTLHIMRDRLKISKWIEDEIRKADTCPFCDAKSNECDDTTESLVQALRKTENEIEMFSEVPSTFDREYALVKSEIDSISDELKDIQKQIHIVAGKSKEQQKLLYTLSEADRFIGRLEEAMNTFSVVHDDTSVIEEIDSLKQEIERLNKLVSGASVRRRHEQALSKISRIAGNYINKLDTESPEDAIALDIKSLTVVIKKEARDYFLWEIGSGSNWLAYHISTILALHKYFLLNSKNPVPSFAVFDQPSQVYFPQKVYIPKDDGDYWPDIQDHDVESVEKIFSLMDVVAASCLGKIQLFVLDHAPKEVWKNCPNVYLVETWRDGKKLVPKHWLPDEQVA